MKSPTSIATTRAMIRFSMIVFDVCGIMLVPFYMVVRRSR